MHFILHQNLECADRTSNSQETNMANVEKTDIYETRHNIKKVNLIGANNVCHIMEIKDQQAMTYEDNIGKVFFSFLFF